MSINGVHCWLRCLSVLFCLSAMMAAERIDAGRAFDLQGFINQRLAAGETHIVVPPGRHRVTPKNRVHLQLAGLRNVTIDCQGAELICTQTTAAVAIKDCSRLTLKGLTIDYDPLPYTQGEITAVADDRAWFEMRIIDGYPDQRPTSRIEIFDAKTQELKKHTQYNWKPVVKTAERRYRVEHDKNYAYNAGTDTEAVGDIVVLDNASAPDGSIPHGVSSEGCENLTLEGIVIHAGNCFGFIEHHNTRSVYRGCRVDRRSPADDLVSRAIPRLRSTDADAFHSIGAEVGPALLNCVARGQGDDGVNIRGVFYQVISCQDGELRLAAQRHAPSIGRLSLRAGDPLQVMAADGTMVPGLRLASLGTMTPLSEDDRAAIAGFRLLPNVRDSLAYAFTARIEGDAQLEPGAVICAENRIGSGFRIEDCTFQGNRSRGILIKASHGTIQRNRIIGTWEEAILIAPEYCWLEGGSASDLVIADNVIADCHRGLAIQAVNAHGAICPAGAHQRIAITGNSIAGTTWPAILATSVQGLTVERNTIDPNPPEDLLRNERRSRQRLRSMKIPLSGPLEPILTVACEP